MGIALITRNGNGHRNGGGKHRHELVRAAGALLPIAALGADGTVVLEDGSLVHVVACAPPNQESMDSEQVEQAFWGFRALAAALERGQVLQMQIEGDLLETGEHLEFYRRQLEASQGIDPAVLRDQEAMRLPEERRARWALYRMLGESVRRSAPEGFTMRRRCYLVVRYRPEFDLDPSLADALPAWIPGSRARRLGELDSVRRVRERSLREHRRVVRRAMNRVRGFVHHLARDDIHGRVLNGAEVLRYLVSRCNPTSATWGRLEESAAWDGVLSRFDSPVEREQAKEAAGRLREQVARSPLDFRRSVHHGEVEQDLVRTGYLGGSPSSTRMFWLRELLHQPLPFTLTVFLHGLAARAGAGRDDPRLAPGPARERAAHRPRPARRRGGAPGARAGAAGRGDGQRPAGRAGRAVHVSTPARSRAAAGRERPATSSRRPPTRPARWCTGRQPAAC